MIRRRHSTKLARELRRLGISTENFAAGIPLTPGALRNIACGSVTSLNTRQKITNLLGLQIWDDVRVTARSVVIPMGLRTVFATEKEAIAVEGEFAGFIKRDGRSIHFTKPAPALLQLTDDESALVRETPEVTTAS